MSAGPVETIRLHRVEIRIERWRWDFAVERRAEIDRHFAARQRQQPALWNGRVLLLNRYAVDNGILRGACFETDYASFLAWHEWDFTDRNVFNVFAAAALRSADGAYLLGEMAPHTASAGQIYFPCGTPDPDDLNADGKLDVEGSLRRELFEETGLDIATLDAEPGWQLVRDGNFLALMKKLTAADKAQQLRDRIMSRLRADANAEFSDIHILRGRADLNSQIPRFVVTFLEGAWRQ